MPFKPGYTPANRGKSKTLDFLRGLIGHTGSECVAWPFARNENGYGTLKYGPNIRKAHRVMCILAHGEPPEPRFNASHSCGNGAGGCVNPNHLSWKTPSENAYDTVRDGRARKKGRPFAKLTQEQVGQIRAMGDQKTRAELAIMFNVHRETIGNILRGTAWTGKPGFFNRRFPPNVRDRIARQAKALRDSGVSLDKIGSELGISRATVRNYINEVSS